MDFMEMREALKNVASRLAVDGNEDGFYGARPGTASLAMARAVPVEAISRHASAACIGYDPRIAPGSERKPN